MVTIKLTCLGPAENFTFAIYQNTVLQYHLHIAIFGKTVMIYWLKVEATKWAKDMGISNIEGKEVALGQAAKCGDLSLVNYFLALDADPNIWDEHHIFPLHWAVQSGDVRICEVLIKAGADVNARTDVWNRVGGTHRFITAIFHQQIYR